jgi:hypothetical protein
VDPGEDGWEADSRICMVLLGATYRLIAGKGHGLDVTLGNNSKSKVCRKATGNIYDLGGIKLQDIIKVWMLSCSDPQDWVKLQNGYLDIYCMALQDTGTFKIYVVM